MVLKIVHRPRREDMNGKAGERKAITEPVMKSAPVDSRIRVNKSDLICTVRTRPATRFPESSSNLTVTVASPSAEGSRLCQIICVEDTIFGNAVVTGGDN